MRVPSTDGVQLGVHDLGGEGPPVLFAHATGFHGHVWEPLARDLRGLHAWSLDLRGHGCSALPADVELRWEGFADDVLAAVDALALERPFGVGHSGGGAGLLLAEQRRPGTFRALFLYEPVVMPPEHWAEHPDHDNVLSVGARRRRATFASRDAAFEHYGSKPPFEVLDPEALRAYVDHGFADTGASSDRDGDGSVVLRCEPHREAEVYATAALHRAHAHLADVGCPVTVAVGHDVAMPPGLYATGIVAALPQGHLETFDDLGHFGPLESPSAMALGIRRAFAGL